MGHRRLPMEPCRLVGSIDGKAHMFDHDAPGWGECPRHSTKRGARSTKGVGKELESSRRMPG
jgi:hypothetical protein